MIRSRRPVRFAIALARATEEPGPPSLVPPVDVVDEGPAWRFVFEVAGADAKSLSVDVDGRVVVVRGTRNPTGSGGGTFLRVERPSGAFERALELPAEPEPEGAEASYSDGLLVVRLLKKKSRPGGRSIPIRKGPAAGA